MAAHEHANLVRQAVDELWNQGDLDFADQLFAPNYVNHGGLIPDMVRGPEGVKLSVTVCRLAFPQLHITVESLVAQEESVAIRWSARSAPRTDHRPPAAAKGSGVLDGVTFGRFSDCQIVESWTYWNRAAAPGL